MISQTIVSLMVRWCKYVRRNSHQFWEPPTVWYLVLTQGVYSLLVQSCQFRYVNLFFPHAYELFFFDAVAWILLFILQSLLLFTTCQLCTYIDFLRVWFQVVDTKSLELVHTFQVPSETLQSKLAKAVIMLMSTSSDGQWLAAATSSGHVVVFNMETLR